MTTLDASPTVYTDVAQAILAACENGLTADGLDLPSRRYVEAGEAAAYDVQLLGKTGCEALIVAAARPAISGVSRQYAPGQDGRATRATKPNPLTANYTVHVAHCYPAADRGGPPKVDAVLAAAERIWSVGFSARRGLVNAADDGTLVGLMPTGDTRATRIGFHETGPLNPYGPSGGVVAVTFGASLRI